MQKLQCGMRRLFDYFSRFINNFLCYIFQKQASKDHLTQGNLLKTTLINEKQYNLEKEMYTPNIFQLGQEVMLTKHTFTF